MSRDRLADTKARQAKPGPKPYKLSDGSGLFLLVSPNGSRYWRLKYRIGGYPIRSIIVPIMRESRS